MSPELEELECMVFIRLARDLWALALCISYNGHRMQKLTLHLSTSGRRKTPLPYDSLAPLLLLRTITHSKLDYLSSSALHIENSYVLAMSQAWSALKSLSLISGPVLKDSPRADGPALSPDALQSLGRNCPSLEYAQFTSLHTASEVSLPLPSVRTKAVLLHLLRTSIVEPERVAAVLDLIWHNVKISWYSNYEGQEHSEAWGLVQRILAAMQFQRSLSFKSKRRDISFT